MKRFILILICLFAIIPFNVKADNGYEITSYDVDIKVHENNTYDIKEVITANFDIPKHGLMRYIPLRNEVKRTDGTKYINRAEITNIKVDNTFKVSNKNMQKVIQIGEDDKTVTGLHTYTISYTYNIGKDNTTDYDEFYFNIIGTEWDTSISNVSFTITMPKEFDTDKLGFSAGKYGTIGTNNIIYNIDGNVITGYFTGTLDAYEGINIRLELPEGYFINAGHSINLINYLFILLPIIFLVLSIILWYKFGKDNEVIETVEFYPPEGFNSLEIGFLYKGKADNQDVTSLLIYLANRGYLKISELEENNLFFKSKDFKLTKLKDYDGNNTNERLFLNGLFNQRDEVTLSELHNNFYLTTNNILKNINSKENKNKIFERTASNKKIFIILMIIFTFCLITIPPIYSYGNMTDLIFALLFPGIGFTVMFYMLFSGNQTIYINGKASNSPIGSKIFAIIWGCLFGGIPWKITVLPTLLLEPIYLIIYITGIICILGMTICFKYLPKRNKYGNEILGKICGFKNFLETAKKNDLEVLVSQKPNYFYDILPYTYVLGVSDKWIKEFESINLQQPTWYSGRSDFNYIAFSHFMTSAMTSATSAMSSSPSSSSGGGFSGGGSGGGGGGSW